MPGHSYMPADSIHSTIDSFIKRRVIWAPTEWPTIISNARINPGPYKVFTISYKDFIDFKSLYASSFHDKKLKISQVKSVLFHKGESYITIRYSYLDTNSTKIPCFIRRRHNRTEIPANPSAYENKLPISAAKFKDLQRLCQKSLIPTRFHDEYAAIPYDNIVTDVLPETDDEE